jgi:hypothetical protein
MIVRTVDGGNPIEVDVVERFDGVRLTRPHVLLAGYCLDENHAAALVLALQAAVAEIQARAVSR